MLITSLRASIYQSIGEVWLTGVAPLGLVSHIFLNLNLYIYIYNVHFYILDFI
jgi:hypothetical protein